jgi:hypothetical protein
MKKIILLSGLLLVSLGGLLAWGVWGHQHINRAAVLALPTPMRVFFYNHIDFVTEESVVPDIRKFTLNDKAEFPRHYIDLESYDPEAVVAHLPVTMAEARAKYSDTFLVKNGMLPWYIQEMQDKLTKAFREGKKTEILFLAADLGHYIGDAHMPLHTALNHDGKLTGQKGMHAFWEGQLPELYGDSYNLYTGEARYIKDIVAETWAMIDSAHRLASRIYALDKELAATMSKGDVFVLDSAGNVVLNQYKDPVHTRGYAKLYHARLEGMIEAQLRGAIAETSSFWYTAWVNAGKPDLSGLDPEALTKRNAAFLARDWGKWKEGKVDMVKAGGDFGPWVR